jgi:hypothetical protein
MENREVNELLEFDGVVNDWLSFLVRVSAKLYEVDSDVWSVFEPARKRLGESLAWLEFEGEVELANSKVSDALNVLGQRLPKVAQQWRAVAPVARAALGRAMLRELLVS